MPKGPEPIAFSAYAGSSPDGGAGSPSGKALGMHPSSQGSAHTCIGRAVDILPAMNDQDSTRSPEGNVLRFALHRQGQNSQVSTRCHGMPCRSSLLVLPSSVGLGYRPTGLNVQPSTDRRKGFLPALNARVSTLVTRGDVGIPLVPGARTLV